MWKRLNVKYRLFLSDFNKTWTFRARDRTRWRSFVDALHPIRDYRRWWSWWWWWGGGETFRVDIRKKKSSNHHHHPAFFSFKSGTILRNAYEFVPPVCTCVTSRNMLNGSTGHLISGKFMKKRRNSWILKLEWTMDYFSGYLRYCA